MEDATVKPEEPEQLRQTPKLVDVDDIIMGLGLRDVEIMERDKRLGLAARTIQALRQKAAADRDALQAKIDARANELVRRDKIAASRKRAKKPKTMR